MEAKLLDRGEAPLISRRDVYERRWRAPEPTQVRYPRIPKQGQQRIGISLCIHIKALNRHGAGRSIPRDHRRRNLGPTRSKSAV